RSNKLKRKETINYGRNGSQYFQNWFYNRSKLPGSIFIQVNRDAHTHRYCNQGSNQCGENRSRKERQNSEMLIGEEGSPLGIGDEIKERNFGEKLNRINR